MSVPTRTPIEPTPLETSTVMLSTYKIVSIASSPSTVNASLIFSPTSITSEVSSLPSSSIKVTLAL